MTRWTQRIGPLLALAMLFVSAYNAWTWSGPYRWFAEFQLGMPAESYDLTLTFLLTYLAWLVACLPVFIPLRIVNGRPAGNTAVESWIEAHQLTFVLGLVAAGLLGVATYFAIDAAGMGELTPVDIATLEAGGEPVSRWVELHGGRARADLAMGLESSERTRVFVPVGAADKHGYTVFLEFSEADWAQVDASHLDGPWEGVLYADGLPGMLRESWVDEGVAATEHTVLRTDASPSFRWGIAGAMGGCGLLVAVALAIVRSRAARPRGSSDG